MIVSCGDSFFYGSDLRDPNSTWPALVAQKLGVEHHCLAQPGVGNLRIIQQVIEALDRFGPRATYLVNWTWIDRFDYVHNQDAQWHTIRPALNDSPNDDLYYRHFQGELSDKFRNLIYVSHACDIMQGHRCVMTYMDRLLLDQQWHAPAYVQVLQNNIRQHLRDFDGQTFLEWSRDHGFAESQGWHPLEAAHVAAADHWLHKVSAL